jgi:hypothetical protein
VKGEYVNERFRRASKRFERKPRKWRPTNTVEAIRQIVRQEVLRTDTARHIVRKSGVLSAMGDYIEYRNNMEPDAR